MKNKMLVLGAGCFAGVILVSCQTVDLTACNMAGSTRSVQVAVVGKNGLPKSTIDLGRLDYKATVSRSISANEGDVVTVTAAAPNSGISYSEPLTVPAKPEPFPWTVNIYKEDVGSAPDPAEAAAKLLALFSEIKDAESYGFAPVDRDVALASYLNCFVLIDTLKKAEVYRTAQVVPVNYLNFKYSASGDKATTVISREALAQVKVTVPVYASIMGSTSAADYYSINAEIKGFGWYDVPRTVSPFGAFQMLTDADKNYLIKQLTGNSNLQLLYITGVYAIQSAIVEKTEGKKVSGSGNVSAVSMVTVNGVYEFSSQQKHTQSRNDFVVCYRGSNIDPTAIGVKNILIPLNSRVLRFAPLPK